MAMLPLGQHPASSTRFLDRRTALACSAILLVLIAFGSRVSRPSRASGEVVWASEAEGLVQARLAEPHDDLRLTLAHAVVRRNDETHRLEGAAYERFVSFALHVESLPYHDPGHQIHSYNLQLVVKRFTCEHDFAGASFTTEGELRHLSWMMLANCPLPVELDEMMAQATKKTLSTTLVWQYKGDGGESRHSIALKAFHPEKEQEFGVCLSPVWGHLDARATLEWRENMRRNGVNTVHWHARDASVGDFVHRYVQIIYYISCKLRSHQRYPTRWIGFLDRDEDFIPRDLPPTLDAKTGARIPASDATSPSLLPDYFATVDEDIGSVCFGKGYHEQLLDLSAVVPEGVAKTQPLELAYFERYSPITPSVKCMHRVNGVELANVHYGERWYPGFRQEIHHNESDASIPFRFVHQAGHGNGNGGAPPYDAGELARYLGNLWIERERERVWEAMGWHCDEVPCRFARPPVVANLPSV